ncbi:MAG: DUF6115 domain-containing protein [Acetivibrionales bacterium]|jgi:ATP/maltotriose-dependent transcriptional regulator MalT
MNQFYSSISIIGITLIILSLLWIVIDRKKSDNYEKRLDRKKYELSAIITDAEEMIEELNKFSEYIVTQIDMKNEELLKSLKNIEERLESLNEKSYNQNDRREPEQGISPKQSQTLESDKVIPIDGRFRRVLALAQDGLSHTEIAKNLNMGKGEIQLILGINK